MSHEIELRFSVKPKDLSRLKTAHALGVAAGPPATQRLSSVYYDTPTLDLAKAGWSLRVRKAGRQYLQTIKSKNVGALASERAEIQWPIPSNIPDLANIPDVEARSQVAQIADGVAVQPILQTEIQRTTRVLKTPTGEQIELALDKGEIRTLMNGRSVLPVNEIELELKNGSRLALYEVARRLSETAPLVLATESKAERGLRALKGDGLSPKKAGRVEFARTSRAEEAFRAVLTHCLAHIVANVGAISEARDPEGVHQLRVGLRRLRAALSAFGPAFRVPALRDLGERAKTLAERLGETRELDVFAHVLLAPIEEEMERPGVKTLRLALDEVRGESWDRAVRLVCSETFTAFVLDLAAAIEARVWRAGATPERFEQFLRPARSLAAKSLDRIEKKAGRRAKHISELDTAQRHRLRIALKRLRYTAEFFAPVFGQKRVTPYLRRLSQLQDLFGILSDAATADRILRLIRTRSEDAGEPERCEAAGFVQGWHSGRIAPTWKKARKRWKRFAKTDPFWRN
jgi:inorganic triphosphatase YgiF